MITKDTVEKIKKDLAETNDSVSVIANRYSVSKATVNNINSGKNHKESRVYPIRQPSNNYYTDNEVGFIRDLAEKGYSAKQIHIILTKGSYSTISNIVAFKTRPEIDTYESDPFLDERKKVFDFIITPHSALVNQFTSSITIEDARYIKLLGRFMADPVSTLEIFLPIIENDMVGFNYKIKTREDIERYLEWGGSTFGTIWWVKSIFNNKINRIGESLIHYDEFPIAKFKEVDRNINLIIIKEMIDFETKENYTKSVN